MADPILCQAENGITRITLNKPESGNRISNEMGGMLAGMLGGAEKNSKLIVFAAAGKDFCLGRDAAMMAMAAPGSKATAMDIRRNNTDPALALYDAFRRCPLPIVGVVKGGAHGLGTALAALCDITIAAKSARFMMPEMKHDLPPALLMSAVIDRMPRKAIQYMVYTTEEISAEEARAYGILSKVTPDNELEGEAEKLVANLAERSAPALRAVKEYMRVAPAMEPRAAPDFASNLLSNVLASR